MSVFVKKISPYPFVQIVLQDSDPVILMSNRCSCVAGTAVCNYTVALLFQTSHYSELNMQVVPLIHTCTETEQQWHKPRTAIVEMQFIGLNVLVSLVGSNIQVETMGQLYWKHGLLMPESNL